MAPENVEAFATELVRLLRSHAGGIDPVGLERARNQLAVRRIDVRERPYRCLEEAALDVFTLGRVRTHAERLERLLAVTGEEVRAAFERMLGERASVAIAGRVRAAAQAHLKSLPGRDCGTPG
jgi:predicted Zn-dependent peptidase